MGLEDEEFEIAYEDNDQMYYMTIAEFLTDLHCGDICFE